MVCTTELNVSLKQYFLCVAIRHSYLSRIMMKKLTRKKKKSKIWRIIMVRKQCVFPHTICDSKSEQTHTYMQWWLKNARIHQYKHTHKVFKNALVICQPFLLLHCQMLQTLIMNCYNKIMTHHLNCTVFSLRWLNNQQEFDCHLLNKSQCRFKLLVNSSEKLEMFNYLTFEKTRIYL